MRRIVSRVSLAPPAPARRSSRRSVVGALLAAILLVSTSGGVAHAIASSGGGGPSGPIETLCDGACAGLFDLVTPEGEAYDFGFAGRVVEQDLDLTLHVGGDLYLLGPLEATGDIWIETSSIVVVDGGAIGIPTHPPIVGGPRPGAGSVTIGAGGQIDLGDLDARVIRADGGAIDLSATTLVADLTVVAAVMGLESPDGGGTSPGFAFERDGDVYLDVSGVTFSSFSVKAGGSIAVVAPDHPTKPIPEPGTAPLLGLGLALYALAIRRTR